MAYAVPTAWYPFGSDQGIHWYLGHALLHGQMPYASGISGKPPLIFVVHAIAELLFGNRQSSIRLLEIALLPAFGWLIAKAVRRPSHVASDGEAGMAAMLLSAATFTYQDYWNTAHPEVYMTLALVSALVVAVHSDRPRLRPLAVGALAMIAFLLKYPAAAVAIPIAAYCGFRTLYAAPTWRWFLPSGAGWLGLLRETILFLAGAAIVFGLVLLPFVLTGTVREMIEVCVDMTENYASESDFPLDWYTPMFDKKVQGTMFLGTSAIFGFGLLVTLARRRFRELSYAGFLVIVALSSIASVVLQKRLFTYHWLAAYPFFVALAVWALSRSAGELPFRRSIGPVLIALAAFATFKAFEYEPRFITHVPRTYREHVMRWWPVVTGEAPHDTLWLSYVRVAEADRFGDLVRASDVVRERAKPGDSVCLTCFISPIYQLTGMRCTTRHAIGTFVGMGPENWREEYDRAMRETPPRFAVSIHTYPRRNRKLRALGFRQIARFGTVIVFERDQE